MIKIQYYNGTTLQLEELPECSVALDGIVQGPAIDVEHQRYSFDHHAGCLRLITAATCEQVLTALLFGLNLDDFTIHVNDLDGDTIMSLWLLTHQNRLDEPRVRQLVRAVGAVDSHGPSGYLLLSDEERGLAEAFFSTDGINGIIPRDVQKEFAQWGRLVSRSCSMINLLLKENMSFAPTPPPPMTILYKGDVGSSRCCVVEADGFGAFDPMYRRGYDVVIICSAARGDGRRTYTVGKKSDLVAYKLGPHTDPDTLLGFLAKAEPGWGGGSSIGGAPRPGGSALTPLDIWEMAGGEVEG